MKVTMIGIYKLNNGKIGNIFRTSTRYIIRTKDNKYYFNTLKEIVKHPNGHIISFKDDEITDDLY